MRQCHNCPWDSDVSLSSPYFLPGPFSLEGVGGQGVLMPGQPSLITGLSLPSQDASGAGPGECVGLGPPQLLSVSTVTLGTTLTAQPHPAFWAPGSQGVCGPSMQRVRGPSWGRGLQPEPPQDGPQRATVATLPFFPCLQSPCSVLCDRDMASNCWGWKTSPAVQCVMLGHRGLMVKKQTRAMLLPGDTCVRAGPGRQGPTWVRAGLRPGAACRCLGHPPGPPFQPLGHLKQLCVALASPWALLAPNPRLCLVGGVPVSCPTRLTLSPDQKGIWRKTREMPLKSAAAVVTSP